MDSLNDDRGQAILAVVLALGIAATAIVGLRAAEERIGRVLGMRHQAEDGAGVVEDAGDRAGRAVEIVAVA